MKIKAELKNVTAAKSQMTVHNTNKLPVIPIADLLPTQGNLKDLDETNYGKLKNNIERRGFIDPVAVWVDTKTNPIYISEYKAPVDFAVLRSWPQKSTLQGGVQTHLRQPDECLFTYREKLEDN